MRKFFEFIDKNPTVFLGVLVLLNLVIRFFQISSPSIWQDEAYTITESLKPVKEIISDSSADQNPPFYFILVSFWVKLFGISEIGVRSFSVFFNALATIALFLFARKYINITAAVIASLLFSFSSLQIYFSLEARSYELVAFLTVLSFTLFTDIVQNPRYSRSIILGFINALLIYSHFVTGFIVIVQLVFGLFYGLTSENRKIIPKVILSTFTTLLLFTPWTFNLLANIPKSGSYWLEKPSFYNLKGLFIDFSNGKIVTIVVALLVAISFIYFARQYLKDKKLKQEHYMFMMLLLWFLMPVILDYVIAYVTPIFLTKYLLYSSIGMYLLMGYILSMLPIKKSYANIMAVCLLVIFIASTKLKVYKTEDWKAASSYIKTAAAEKDMTYLTDYCVYMPFTYYYDRKTFSVVDSVPSLLKSQKIYPVVELSMEQINLHTPSGKIFLVQSHVLNSESEKSPAKVLGKNFRSVEEKKFGDISITTFEK